MTPGLALRQMITPPYPSFLCFLNPVFSMLCFRFFGVFPFLFCACSAIRRTQVSACYLLYYALDYDFTSACMIDRWSILTILNNQQVWLEIDSGADLEPDNLHIHDADPTELSLSIGLGSCVAVEAFVVVSRVLDGVPIQCRGCPLDATHILQLCMLSMTSERSFLN